MFEDENCLRRRPRHFRKKLQMKTYNNTTSYFVSSNGFDGTGMTVSCLVILTSLIKYFNKKLSYRNYPVVIQPNHIHRTNMQQQHHRLTTSLLLTRDLPSIQKLLIVQYTREHLHQIKAQI